MVYTLGQGLASKDDWVTGPVPCDLSISKVETLPNLAETG